MPSNSMPTPDAQGLQYKLRAGGPSSRGNQGAGDFYVHTFMAEQIPVDIYLCTDTLPASTDFRGQGGDYVGGQFSRLGDRSGQLFGGSVTYESEYIEETNLNTSSPDFVEEGPLPQG